MKKFIYALLFLTLLLNSSLSAQTGVRFGVKGGYSLSTQYGITVPDIPYTVKTHWSHGFAGGVFAYFPITESFGIQQEVLYITKGSSEDITMNTQPVKTHTEYFGETVQYIPEQSVQLKRGSICGTKVV